MSAWEDVLLVDAFALLPKVLLQRLRDCGPLVDGGAVATFIYQATVTGTRAEEEARWGRAYRRQLRPAKPESLSHHT
ncbi:hypothetical protein DIPPA_34923 [Diplonema papillatum]|nr:hypothetical protein DIPPA_34923 [Diplonema papillatum]